VVGRRDAWAVAAVLVVAGSGVAACSITNPASDFCTSYGDAVHEIVVAARKYDDDPAAFDATYKSMMDNLGKVRSKAPDATLRAAFDRSMFTFSVFDTQRSLAAFIGRADFSGNAVVVACAEYGVEIRV
jgi:hypothetical protein